MYSPEFPDICEDKMALTFAQVVERAIRQATPAIEGVSIGRVNDKATWKVVFSGTATPADRTAAANAIESTNIQTALALVEVSKQEDSLDNLSRVDRAVLLCIAQVGGLTVPQIRALFRSKYESLG